MADRVVIVGGGPGGYEAAHVAAQLGAEVTVVDTDGVGGSAVLTDCVPSKTLIATAELMTEVSESAEPALSVAVTMSWRVRIASRRSAGMGVIARGKLSSEQGLVGPEAWSTTGSRHDPWR